MIERYVIKDLPLLLISIMSFIHSKIEERKREKKKKIYLFFIFLQLLKII